MFRLLLVFLILTACTSTRVESLLTSAAEYQAAGQYQKALKDFSAAEKLDPNNLGALSGKVAALLELGQLTEAEQAAQLVVELAPESSFPHYNLGLIEMKKSKFQSAIKRFSKAMEISPKWAAPIWNRATAYDELAEWDKAIQDYDRALVLEPKNADIYNNRGYTKYKLQDYQGSFQDLSTALKLNPKHKQALSNMQLLKNRQSGFKL